MEKTILCDSESYDCLRGITWLHQEVRDFLFHFADFQSEGKPDAAEIYDYAASDVTGFAETLEYAGEVAGIKGLDQKLDWIIEQIWRIRREFSRKAHELDPELEPDYRPERAA